MSPNQQDACAPQGKLAFSTDTEDSEKQNQIPWFSCVASTIWTPFTEHWDPLRGIRVTVPPTFSKTQCSLSKSRPWRTRREKQRRKLVPTQVSAIMTPNYVSLFHLERLLLSTKALWTITLSESAMSRGRDRGIHDGHLRGSGHPPPRDSELWHDSLFFLTRIQVE